MGRGPAVDVPRGVWLVEAARKAADGTTVFLDRDTVVKSPLSHALRAASEKIAWRENKVSRRAGAVADRAAAAEFGSGAQRRLGNSQTEFPPSPGARLVRRRRGRRQSRSARILGGVWKGRRGLEVDMKLDGSGEGVYRVKGERDPARLVRCGWACGGDVEVIRSGDGRARFGSIETCASVWACPTCSPKIRHGRGDEITEAVRRWREQGGQVRMLTLTLRHRREDSLQENLDVLLKAWQRTLAGAPWKRQRVSLGIQGYVRAVEVTWAWENGWHPHAHVLLFTDPWTELQQAGFSSWITERWIARVTALGGRSPSVQHGVDLTGDADALGAYLSKLQDDKLGSELARGDLKAGRGSLVPFELLDPEVYRAAGVADGVASMLWAEFAEATMGRRFMTWSRGFRDFLGLGDVAGDEDLVDESTASDEVIARISIEDWKQLSADPEWRADVLDASEAVESVVLAGVAWVSSPFHESMKVDTSLH